MSSQIKAIIFDCFGVLYVDPSHAFYENYLDDHQRLMPELLDINRAYDFGSLSLDDYYQAVSDATGLDKRVVADNIHGDMERNDQLIELSQALRGKWKIGLLSNVGRGSMSRYFSEAEQEELFDAVVLSYEVGAIKPQPEVYQVMADKLGVETSQCIMIDDSRANCQGAEKTGMLSLVFQGNKKLKRDFSQLNIISC